MGHMIGPGFLLLEVIGQLLRLIIVEQFLCFRVFDGISLGTRLLSVPFVKKLCYTEFSLATPSSLHSQKSAF